MGHSPDVANAVTVADVLTLPVFSDSTIHGGGRGLDRRVSGINVMEVPDIERFVHPGELLLTTAYPLRDRADGLPGLIRQLSQRELAGLIVKPHRYLEELTAAAAQVADELRFPVIRLSGDLSFNEAIESVLSVVLTDYGPDPGPTHAIRERLTAAVLVGGGLPQMATALAGALDRAVEIRGADERVLGAEGTMPDQHRDYPVTVAGEVRGAVRVSGHGEVSLGHRRLIQQACFAAGLHLAQLSAAVELDRRLRVVTLEEMVSRTAHASPLVTAQARALGLELEGPCRVVLARCAGTPSDVRLQDIAVATFGPGTLAWSRAGEAVAIVASEALVGDGCARSWGERLRKAGASRVITAVGSQAADPGKLPASHATAREALRIAAATRSTCVCADDLALERAMLAMPDDLREELVYNCLGALIQHDDSTGGSLCETLWEYLGSGSGAETARTLYIHYNTLKNRLAQVKRILDVDLSDPRTRLTLLLALQARRLTRPAGLRAEVRAHHNQQRSSGTRH